MTKKAPPGYYAVRIGREVGVYNTWDECENQVKGFPGAKYKKFSTETAAHDYIYPLYESELPESGPSNIAKVESNDQKGKKRVLEETQDKTRCDIVYSDGACKGNGKPGSVAGIGVWWGHNDPRNLAERCPGDQTNNRAELIAILRVLETTPISQTPLIIKTDSKYSISCFESWIRKWMKNNWRTASGDPVKNVGIIRCLSKLLDIRGRSGHRVDLQYVKGHSGDVGNDGADLMANQGTLKPEVEERDWGSLERNLDLQLSQIGSVNGRNVVPVAAQEEPVQIVDPEPRTKIRKVETSTPLPSSRLFRQDTESLEVTPASAKLPTQSTSAAVELRNPASVVPPSRLIRQDEESPSGNPPSPMELPTQSTPIAVESKYPTHSKANLQNISSPTKSSMNSLKPGRSTSPANFAGYHSYPKSPVRVIYAYPPFVPVRAEEVDFDDYADYVLDDEDLAAELSDF